MFIDIHVHTVAQTGANRYGTDQTYATPEQLIEMYDEVGIEKAVILPGVNPECAHRLQSNEEAIAVARQYPDRFIAFCNIDPRMVANSPDADLGYLMEYYKEQGCPGIGEVCANLYFDDPLMDNLFHHAEKTGMLLDFHVATRQGNTYGIIDDLGMPRFETEIQRHPNLVWLCHSQAWWSHISGDVTEDTRGGYPKGPVVEGGRVVELMRRYPNVMGDLSAGSGYNAVSRAPEFGYAFMAEFQDRLCFGTDVCAPSNRENVLVNLANFMKQGLADGKISQEVFNKIARKNAIRLLGLDE
jgi:uncharacterized protein